MSEEQGGRELLGLTAQIVAAHVSNNSVPLTDVPSLIEQVHRTLSGLGAAPVAVAAPVERPQPAVPVKKSVTDEYLVCLEDGKKLKMLKRHLKTAYDMTPEQYRERWGLPQDYPMVAPNYAKHRSSLAKKIGLGTKPRGGRPRRGAAAAA
ncbi:MucR family transcriptional regulator [Pseudoroseomonas deserti]|uniref:MucR family transcriptional regulator n=1 Tax=Teichococcus deserti TaxID=1817963 RepID=A0A1V2H2E3_9PROT|nr:MucR family transcriptional regulator [Pseudoroseomonas deserti]ONG52732.1 MucR family transcriptional regulator [Pseudoroseomonas deserti]